LRSWPQQQGYSRVWGAFFRLWPASFQCEPVGTLRKSILIRLVVSLQP
jgi:hypothetical protein